MVRLLHALKAEGIQDWRLGVALNAFRAATAIEDDRDARTYLAEVGFKALPGFVRDLKDYEIVCWKAKPSPRLTKSSSMRKPSCWWMASPAPCWKPANG